MDAETAPTSGDVYTDSLAEKRWIGTALTFSFPTMAGQYTGYSGGSEPFSNFEALNAGQQAAVRAIFGAISSFTNLTFTEITGGGAGTAVLRFGMTDASETAHAYLPTSSELGGDSWYNNSGGDYDDPVRGNYAWHTLLHEVGHALGLGHPHESTPAMPVDRDIMIYTVMSYRSGQAGDFGYPNEDWSFAQTYMAQDIAALQFLYGANFNHNNTNTVYQWNPATGEMSVDGVGQGAPGSKRVFQAIWDGGGEDTYDLSNFNVFDSNGVIIDLRPGAFTSLPPANGHSPILGGFIPGTVGSIANALQVNGDPRSLIENAVGTSAIDTIYGNDVANRLDGGAGNDRLEGFGGNDILIGGDGLDHLYGNDGDDSLYGGTFGDFLYGGEGSDLLDGGDDDDRLRGENGDDILLGGAGWDELSGGEGADTLRGGASSDRLYGDTGNDTLFGDEGNDLLFGGDGNDTLHGGAGHDSVWGEAGGDVMSGGLGDDHYRFEDAGDQVIEFDGEGLDWVDTWLSFAAPNSIEIIRILGEAALDIVGNDLANLMWGNSAANTLTGGGGADRMIGVYGDDTYYVDDPGDLVYELIGAGIDTVYTSVSYVLPEAIQEHVFNFAGNHTVVAASGPSEVETLVLLGAANLSATGNSIANTLRGNAGNNRLDGKEGADTLIGGLGADELIGGLGADVFKYISLADSVAGAEDWLSDFEHGSDKIDLRDLLVTGLTFEVFSAGSPSEWTRVTAAAIGGPSMVLRVAGTASQADFQLFQSTGADQFLIGGVGNDTLDGLDGNDTLSGNAGRDVLLGGTGNDRLLGGFGRDTIDGGAGEDTLYLPGALVDYTVAREGAGWRVSSASDSDFVVNVEKVALQSATLSWADFTAQAFDAWRYLASNLDVLARYGADPVAARNHYETFGRNEGRSLTAFNPFLYGASNLDVVARYGPDAAAMSKHYLSFGRAEGRPTAKFDPLQYGASNLDLLASFGPDALALTDHYVRFGIADGRPADTFKELLYAASNPDVARAYGSNAASIVSHYVNWGVAEGRPTSGFNALLYAASNIDVGRKYGSNETAIVTHYLNFGVHENRPASGFDALLYAASNIDLATAFGSNVQRIVQHYLDFGIPEGRRTSGFDILEYAAANPDVARARGSSLQGVVQHYLDFGRAEGRPIQGFDEVAYLINNPDLGNAGLDAAGALRHYVAWGVNENRVTTGKFGNEQTGHALADGADVAGTLSPAGDRDWFQFTATAGTDVRLALSGAASGQGTLADPFLRVYDQFGRLIAFDDNSGPGNDALLIFDAPATGVYYAVADSAFASGAGTYLVSLDFLV